MRTLSLIVFLCACFTAMAAAPPERGNSTVPGAQKPAATFPFPGNGSTRNIGAFKWYFTQPGERYFAYEHVLSPRKTIEVGLSYVRKVYLPEMAFIFFDDFEADGMALRAYYRMYSGSVNKRLEAPFGFYHGPGITYRYLRPHYDVWDWDTVRNVEIIRTEYKSFHTLTFQYSLGYQFSMFDVLNLSLFMGPGIRFKYVADDNIQTGSRPVVPGVPIVKSPNSSILFTPVFNMGVSLGFYLQR